MVWQLLDRPLAELIGVLPRTMHEVREQQDLARNPGSASDWQRLTGDRYLSARWTPREAL